MKKIIGNTIDDRGRCEHWNTSKDIISIRFFCCNHYYPCYECHDESVDHKVKLWPRSKWNEKAVLCGACKHEMTIIEYMQSDSICPNCSSDFNPNCENHWGKYFNIKDEPAC